jgi:hypothetical protein
MVSRADHVSNETGEMVDEKAVDFDSIDHLLVLRTEDGAARRLRLQPQTVAGFYAQCMAARPACVAACRNPRFWGRSRVVRFRRLRSVTP